jgi:hypothetical protein
LLTQFVRDEQIRITRLAKDLWQDKNRQQLGACIEVTVQKT